MTTIVIMSVIIDDKVTDKFILGFTADVKEMTTKLTVDEKALKDWPSGDLVVYAEHPSYFYDIMSKEMLSQVDLLLQHTFLANS